MHKKNLNNKLLKLKAREKSLTYQKKLFLKNM